jgi:hypothetical protein
MSIPVEVGFRTSLFPRESFCADSSRVCSRFAPRVNRPTSCGEGRGPKRLTTFFNRFSLDADARSTLQAGSGSSRRSPSKIPETTRSRPLQRGGGGCCVGTKRDSPEVVDSTRIRSDPVRSVASLVIRGSISRGFCVKMMRDLHQSGQRGCPSRGFFPNRRNGAHRATRRPADRGGTAMTGLSNRTFERAFSGRGNAFPLRVIQLP